MSKLLIIDKSVFHKSVLHKDFAERIFKFAQNYRVVFPHALVAECLMSRNLSVELLQRFVDCVKCGGVVGWGSPSIFQNEKKLLRPFGSIVNEDDTMRARKDDLCADKNLLEDEARLCRAHYEFHINWLCQIVKAYLANIEKKGLLVKFRKEVSGISLKDRLVKWVKNLNVLRAEILTHFVPEFAKDLHSDWVTWHLLCLSQAWGIELACRSTTSNLTTILRDISNDFWDIEYVVSLSRADGILTEDKKLIIPLTQAAFPEKDVFSDINEVPNEYMCR